MDVFVWLFSLAISLLIMYGIINGAVRTALAHHYKVVRWYEATGEWMGGKPPRTIGSGNAPLK